MTFCFSQYQNYGLAFVNDVGIGCVTAITDDNGGGFNCDTNPGACLQYL